MSRRDRRKFRSDARRYLTTDPDGVGSVADAAKWLRTLPLIRKLGLTDPQCRKLVMTLRADDRVMFAADRSIEMIKLIEADGGSLSALTILAALNRIGG